MTGSFWLDILVGLAAGVVLLWLALIVALLTVRPRKGLLREAMNLLPDLVRMLRGIAADKEMPRGVRIRIGLLIAYLAMPFDLGPDFIPVLGYADDAIVATVVLRSVVRRAGLDAVHRHWPGSDNGFDAVCRLAGLQRPESRHPTRHESLLPIVETTDHARAARLAVTGMGADDGP